MASPGKPGCVTGVPAPEHATDDPRPYSESVRSDAPLSKKCSRSASDFYQESRKFTRALEGPKPTRNSTQRTATTDRRSAPTTARSATVDHGRPAAQRLLGASSPERAAAARCGPHGIGQPSEGLAPSQRKGDRRGRPEGGPLPCGVGRCRPAGPDELSGHPWSGGRWSA